MELINKNGIDILIKNNEKTPRIALVCCFMINKAEKIAGINSLFTKLLMQGTKKYSNVELLKLIEEKGIEINVRCKQDYLTASVLTLNEDFDLGMEILSDILQNSTFENFEKEIHKMKGEITSDLDHPRLQATDKFVRNIFDGHYYSNTYTKVLENIDSIKKEDIMEFHSDILNSKKVLSVVGDIQNKEELLENISNKFSFMKNNETVDEIPNINSLEENKLFFIPKKDSKQAQVLRGWIVPTYTNEDYPKIVVMNNILGSAGLSSRLFVELRDKKGLAYTVRSSYEPMKRGAILYFYIACDPTNIKNSLDSFQIEAVKLKNIPVSQEELEGAKENILGRLEYFAQTNIQQATIAACDHILGLGLDWEEKYRKMIEAVTAEDVQKAAKYFAGNYVTSTLAPNEFEGLCS